MTHAEFLAGMERLATGYRKRLPDIALPGLYDRVKTHPAPAWYAAIETLLDTHRHMPVRAEILKALEDSRSLHPSANTPPPPMPTMATYERMANVAFGAALRMVIADPGPAKELHAIAAAMASSRPGHCICRGGLVTMHRIPGDDGGLTDEAVAAPCPIGCGAAARIADVMIERRAVMIVRHSTGAVLRYIRSPNTPQKRRQIRDDDGD